MAADGTSNMATGSRDDSKETAREYLHQARRLAHLKSDQAAIERASTHAAVEAKFITPHDPIVITAEGGRLPAVPIDEAVKLNALKAEVEGREPQSPPHSEVRQGIDGSYHGTQHTVDGMLQDQSADATLGESQPLSRTNPLFPPLPLYGPPSLLRTLQCYFFRFTSFWLSLAFLMAIAFNALTIALPKALIRLREQLLQNDPDASRPFHDEEKRRRVARSAAEKAWGKNGSHTPLMEKGTGDQYAPLEGGPDPLICNARYYARRVGLEMESIDVETEDGFIIELWHIVDPAGNTKKKYPVLMIHGLLQSAGAFCCNDDESLAFFLAKSGYDVWLGNNRCGMKPRHTILPYGDARMWCWNIRQMGVLDMPALVDHVLQKTGFPKLALIAHSQGTTQTFVALAKEQRPDVGEKISVFCALAPAVYAGPLVDRIYFVIMRAISPAVFRLIFGIHAFIPFMMTCHSLMPGKIYSCLGYHVFSSLFNWSDERWERDLRDRFFQFAPVYVSAESMRWWLGRECFAKQRCILSTREAGKLEDKEDEEDDELIRKLYVDKEPHVTARRHQHHDAVRGKYAWYDKRFPPLAMWVAGNDDLVDGRRLLRRFDRGREPDVRVVHKKIIEEYEHLDVIWAMDSIEKVGREVREVIWQTVDPAVRTACVRPTDCEDELDESRSSDAKQASGEGKAAMHSRGRLRMASISETQPAQSKATRGEPDGEAALSEGATVTRGTAPRRGSQALFTDIEEKSDPFG